MSLPPPPGEDANGRRYSISSDGSLSVDSQLLSPPLRVSSLPSCGTSHCMALSRAGEVFSWATGRDSNRFGQLGWGTTASDVDLYSPRRVELPRGASATAVAAGACHSAIIDEDKRLWIFGSDRWLQLGQDKIWTKGAIVRRTPVPVGGDVGAVAVVGVACGEDHTLALDEQGTVWAWGKGGEGQLYGASDRPFTAPPKPSKVLTSREGAAAIAAAGHCSCAKSRAGAGAVSCTGKCSQRAKELIACQMNSSSGPTV